MMIEPLVFTPEKSTTKWVVLKIEVPVEVLFCIRVPYELGDLKGALIQRTAAKFLRRNPLVEVWA